MIKKASSLRYPPTYQYQRHSLGNMDAQQQPPPTHPIQTTEYPLQNLKDTSRTWPQQPQQPPFRRSKRTGTGFSYSDHDSLWQIGENAYSYRTIDPDVRAENLRVYRELVGITTAPSLHTQDARISTISYLCFRRPAKNVGYYQRIVDDELKATIWYNTATWAINILLGMQIAIAAVLTALGVSKGHGHGLAISILAACNTATATLLTYLKAKGQPMRALQYRDAMRQLKEHIEYTERLFELGITGGGELNPAKAAMDVKQHYDKVQAEQEKSEEASEAAQLGAHPAAVAGSPTEPKPGRKAAVGTSVLGPPAGPTNPTGSAHDADSNDTAARLV